MKYFSFLIIIILFSCSNNNVIVVLDSYFVEMYNLDINSIDSETLIAEVEDIGFDEISSYKRIIVSPLLYKINKESFLQINNEVIVLGNKLDSYNNDIVFTNIDYSKAYLELTKKLDVYNSKIKILIDYETDSKKQDVEILKNISNQNDVEFMFLNSNTGRSKINNYIQNNIDCDYWIIDSREYGLYIYDLLKDKKIILTESGDLSNINDNIIFSIDYDMEQNISDIVHEKSKTIELILNKH